jgi:3-isopropylmalate dehydratase small subunit
MDQIGNPDTATLTINLLDQAIEAPGLDPITFEIGVARKRNLMAGVDHVGQTLGWASDIKAFESEQRKARNWLWN